MITKFEYFLNENISDNIKFTVESQRFKLFVNDELASFCIFSKIESNNRFLKFDEEVVELHEVNTMEQYKRKGYAELLMKKIFDYVKNTMNINYVILRVFGNNKPAIGLYTKLGFEVKGSDGDEDDPILLMYKKI